MTGPIGDGNGTRAGCRIGLLIAVISTLVVGAILGALAIGVSAIQHQPQSTSSTRSTP